MALHYPKLTILLLLSLLAGGNVSLATLVSIGDDERPLFFLEKEAGSDDAEESSDSKLAVFHEPNFGLCDHAGFRAVSDEVNHQIDWLFVHEYATRAPPLG